MRTVTFVVLLASLSSACITGPCADDVLKEAVSADGTRRAVLRVRDCGATTTWNDTLLVTVPEKWRPVTVFSGPLCVFKPEHIELRWDADDLLVTCKDCCPERLGHVNTQQLGATTVRFEGFKSSLPHQISDRALPVTWEFDTARKRLVLTVTDPHTFEEWQRAEAEAWLSRPS
jgi:hypothetical protein